MTDRNVLIAGIVNEAYECSIAFTTTIIRLQQRIASQGEHACPVGFEFFRSPKDAIDHFRQQTKYTRLVMMDACMGCDVEFILKPRAADIVVAAYPMRSVSFDRVASYLASCKEQGTDPDPSTAQKTSMTYNFTAEAGSGVDQEGCVNAVDPQVRIVSLSREGTDTFEEAFDPHTYLLGGTYPVDVTAKCTNTGLYDFSGTVGSRFVVQAPSTDAPTVDAPTETPA